MRAQGHKRRKDDEHGKKKGRLGLQESETDKAEKNRGRGRQGLVVWWDGGTDIG